MSTTKKKEEKNEIKEEKDEIKEEKDEIKEKKDEKKETKLVGQFTAKGIVFNYEEFCDHVGAESTAAFLKRSKHSKTKRMGQKYKTIESAFYKILGSPDGKRYLVFARFMLQELIEFIRNTRAKRNLQPLWSLKKTVPDGEVIEEARLLPGPVLDSNQQLIVQHLLDNVYSQQQVAQHAASCTVVMGTGAGKSYVAAALVGELGMKTLIIAPSDIVLDETRKALISSYPTLTVGEYTGRSKRDGDVVLMIINSALNNEFRFGDAVIPFYKYFARFGLVIMDEIHNYTSGMRQEIFWRTGFKYGLGLTATPDENPWEMDIVFQKHIGPLVRDKLVPNYNMQSIKWKGMVTPIYYHGPPEHTKELRNDATGWISYGKMVDQFNADPFRNIMLLKKLVQLWETGRNTFIFVTTRDYATTLANAFKRQISSPHSVQDLPDAVILMGGARPDDKEKAAKIATLVFTTFQFGWQGVSIPRMTDIVFANPRVAKMRQIIGRILRKSGDTTITRHIYDIVDIETDMAANEYKERKKIYEESTYYDFEIQEPEITRWDLFKQ